jgi:hypothetical protein
LASFGSKPSSASNVLNRAKEASAC